MSETHGVYTVQATRSARRPWLRCLHCGRRLCQVDVMDGRTCIRAGMCWVRDAVLACPDCGMERKFVSISIVIRTEVTIIES